MNNTKNYVVTRRLSVFVLLLVSIRIWVYMYFKIFKFKYEDFSTPLYVNVSGITLVNVRFFQIISTSID